MVPEPSQPEKLLALVQPKKPASAFILFVQSLKNDADFKAHMEAQPLRPNFLAEATKVWQSADDARKKTFND